MTPRTSPLWTHTAPVAAATPLTEDREVDVAVLGAGITGLTAALRLAEAGRSVTVLEARTIGSGVTGYTTAHATEAVDARYSRLRARFGEDAAHLVARASRAAIEHIDQRARSLAIECDLHRVPGFLYTEDEGQRDFLLDEHQAARRAGVDVTLGAATGLPFPVAGAVRYGDQLRFHPLRYVDGLARAFRDRGGVVFEHTRAAAIEHGDPVTIITDGGRRVWARAVFCATHTPLNRLSLQLSLAHYQSYAAAYPGLAIPDALYWDTADPYHYLRAATIDGVPYLIVGGEDHKTGTEEHTEIAFERLFLYARQRFGTDRPAFRWSAQVVEPADGLPYIGRNPGSQNVYVATGFAGNGMTFGTFGALLVSDLVLGHDNEWRDLFDPRRIKLSSLGRIIREQKDVPVHLIGDRVAPPEARSTDEIEPDQGRLMKVRGERLAVYRDPRGALHVRSAVCTHMKCIVKFNAAERSWDCGCHGSRFGVDGAVLDGPAMSPLPERHLDDVSVPAAAPRHGDGVGRA